MRNNQLLLFFCFVLFGSFTAKAATEQLLISENFQGWAASSASITETTKLVKSMYGEDITYAWKNCAIIPTQVAKSDNGVTSVGAVQTNKVVIADQYFTVSGFASVTRAILKHSYTGSARGCIIQVKGDGDADWVTLFGENTTNAAGQATEIAINRSNVSIRFTGNNAGQNAYLHDVLVYGTTNDVVPILSSINYENNAVIPATGGSFILTFSENVNRGIGDITLGGVVIPESNISILGAVVTITYATLANNANYVFTVPVGAFKNASNVGNQAVISYNYKTPDTIAPTLTKNSIISGATLAVNGFISLIMSEACKAGTATISLGSKNITAAISASNSNLVFINYSGLAFDTDYTLTIPTNAIADLSDNSYAGTSFTFHTEVDARGAQLFSFTPDATTVPASSSGTVTNTINSYLLTFDAVQSAGARSASPYSYAFKTNFVQLPELPSVGELSFYIQCGGGTSPQEYYIQKLANDGTTWNTIETFILGNNDKNRIVTAAAQSSVPTTLRLMYNGTNFWFYTIDAYAYNDNQGTDDGKIPSVVSTIPSASATDIPINGVLKLVYSENVKKGNRDITLDGKVLSASIVGKNVSLPYSNLKYATNYTLNILSGAFKDGIDNNCDGFTLSFTTKAKPAVSPKLFDFVVAADGSGNGTTIQSAFNAVPLNNTQNFLIFVKNGTYNEYPTLADTKNKVSLIGESRDGVIISGNRRSGLDGYTTSTCQTVEIMADEFYCENISMENTAGVNAGQAVALKVYADKAVFKNVKLTSYQDTHLTSNVGTDRQYYLNCDIRGTVDFIFGNGACFFDNTLIFLQDRSTANVICAPSTATANTYGYVFNNCTIDGAGSQDGIYNLGRPWQNSPRAVYLNTKMNILASSGGWINMSTLPALFAEYGTVNGANNSVDLANRNKDFSYVDGGGATINGSSPKAVLTELEAASYTLNNVLSGADSWQANLKTETTAAATNLAFNVNTLSRNVVDGAICYVIEKNGQFYQNTTLNTINTNGNGVYEVIAVSGFGALSTKASITLIETGFTSTNDIETPSIILNYIAKTIRVSHSEKVKNFDIMDITGKILVQVSNVENEVSLSHFTSGVYLVNIYTFDNKRISKKICWN